MQAIIKWWAENSVAANLLMLIIILAGVLGYLKLEREMEPTLPFPGMQITVVWPGANPSDVEEQVVVRIEEALKDIEDLDWIRSTSVEGAGFVYMKAEYTNDFSKIYDEVNARVASISTFPPGIRPPKLQRWVIRREALRIAVHGDVPEKTLKTLAEQYRKEVAALEGVSIVELFGAREEEVSIEVSETALRRYGLSFDTVASAVRANSLNVSAGSVRTKAGQFTLRSKNQANSEVDFNQIVVKQLPQGGVVTLADVATVNDGFEENELLATIGAEPAILIQVQSSENMDVVLMSNSVRKWMQETKKHLPKGVSLTLWQDNAEAFKSRISTISSAAFSGMLLVFLVLFLTLRPRVAFWVAVGIATAYAGTFVFLSSLDISINMLSTFAFLLALGIVVDDAIIIGERVHSEVEQGNTGLSGAIQGASAVSKPVVFGVITTILAFMPFLFLSGITSEFTRQISWVVILALLFSLVEALLILPAHLSNLKPINHKSRLIRAQQKVANGISYFGKYHYGVWLSKSLSRPGLVVSVFAAALIIGLFGVWGAGHVKSAFMPEIESEQISIDVTLNEGTPYERSLEILQQIQAAQDALSQELGEEKQEKVIKNWYTRSRRDSVLALVKLSPSEEREIPAKEVALKLRKLIGDIADAKEVKVSYTNNNDSPDLDFSLRHTNLDVLRLASQELKQKLNTISVVYDVSDNIASAGEEIVFTLRPGAEQLGVNLSQVMHQVRQAYYGEEVQRLPRDGQDVRVMLRYPQASRESIESLKHFRVRLSAGREVPLGSLVELQYAPGLKRIEHWDGMRAVRVNAYLTEPMIDQVMQELEQDFFPQLMQKYPGLKREQLGASAAEKEFFLELMSLLIMAFVGMYFLLAVAFKSYLQPVLILIAIPFAVLGAVIGHWVSGMAISMMSYFGVISACGVVINDNLVLIDAYNRYRQDGLDAQNAIIKAGKMRFRAILVTSITTVIGLIPLMLEQSHQAAWLKPVAVSLSYGLLVAFFVTLFLVPALIVGGNRLRDKRRAYKLSRQVRPTA